MKNHIVIIGGMGPQASVHLHSLLIENKDNKIKQPDEFPMIVHVSIPVPDFIESEEATGRAIQIIQNTCKDIPLESASAVGIACNTAHLLIDKLTNVPKHNFVSMIEAVAEDISEKGFTKVGLMASPFTIKSHLYHNELEKRDIEVIQPSSSDIRILSSIIHDVIRGVSSGTLRLKLTRVSTKLKSKGVDCILLGCTELPLVGIDCNLPVIDSLSCLAHKMLKKHESTV